MLIQLPGGAAIETDGTVVGAEDNGELRMHTDQALSRLVERWKKPVLQALLASYTDELQELETVLWDVLVLRFPDYASGTQLDTLGRIVGELRRGKGDAAFRARIKARIKINSSFGRAQDVIGVLRLVDPAAFRLIELGPASFQIVYSEPAPLAVQGEIPGIVSETRAAGVGASVIQPIDRPGVLPGPFLFCDTDLVPTGAGFGDTSGNYGGALSWYSRA